MSEKETLEVFNDIPRTGMGINNVVDYRLFYQKIEPHLETIRTALLKSAQVDGLVTALRLIDKIANDSAGKEQYKMNQIWHLTQQTLHQFSATEI